MHCCRCCPGMHCNTSVPVMSETNKHMVEPGRMARHEKSLRTVSEAHSQAACIPLPDTIPAPRLAAPLNDLLSKLRPASPAATTWACPSGLMRMSASSCVPRRRCDGVHGAASREGARRIWPLPGVACLPCPHQLLQSATHPPNTLPLYPSTSPAPTTDHCRGVPGGARGAALH